MEKLLNLAPDALTKEIQLTEHLMELFIKYQLPSELLAFAAEDQQVGTAQEAAAAASADYLATYQPPLSHSLSWEIAL